MSEISHAVPSSKPKARAYSGSVFVRSVVIALTAFLTLVDLFATQAIGVGTFFAQATATGFVGRAASSDRGSASGLYLAFYFFGGLMGAAVLGQLFDRFGWEACVAGIGVSLLIAALLAVLLKTPMTPEVMRHDA
jgi:MFS family permease